jgi:uncharacterized membrane protein YccC
MDIVERLRSVTRLLRKTEEASYEQDDTLASEAADEIDRLRERIFSLGHENEREMKKMRDEAEVLREALQKIADIEHEDIPAPKTPNEGVTWTVLAMAVGLAEKALKEGE